MMDWDERVAESSPTRDADLHVARWLARQRQGSRTSQRDVRVRREDRSRAMERLNGKVAELAAEVERLDGKTLVNDAKLMELLNKIEKVWNEQVSVLAKVPNALPKARPMQPSGSRSRSPRWREIAKVDLQLASVGIDLDLGPTRVRTIPAAVARMRRVQAEGSTLSETSTAEPRQLEGVQQGRLFYGEDSSGATLYVAEEHVDGFMDRPPAKPPTEVEARRNRAIAERTKDQTPSALTSYASSLTAHPRWPRHAQFGRVIEGNGLAAASMQTRCGRAAGTRHQRSPTCRLRSAWNCAETTGSGSATETSPSSATRRSARARLS